MADWRQIQARIRKAKGSTNPAEQLAELHQRTRDAMVAFELARLHEKNGDNAEAARWYTTAAQQFRRAQWRVKAEEALSRLGAEIPPRAMGTDLTEAIEESAEAGEAPPKVQDPARETPEEAEEESGDMNANIDESQGAGLAAEPGNSLEPGSSAQPGTAAAGTGRKRRRRGRRGGRKHRRGDAPGEEAGRGHGPAHPGRPAPAQSAPRATVSAPSRSFGSAQHAGTYRAESLPEPPQEAAESEPEREQPLGEPRYRIEPATSVSAGVSAGVSGGRARGAEPALSSRMAQLESRLRRLLACQLAALADAEQAPAGPGVLLLSDSDQVTHYYIEACQTLRIGIANLLRGGRGSKEGGRIKQLMAENLGINESGVSKYMKDHCVIRWLQVDEGAPELAHFAIAVLRPVVNE